MNLLLTSFLISVIAALWVWMAGRKDPHGRPWLTGLCMGMLLILPLLALLPKLRVDVIEPVVGVANGVVSESSMWSWVFLCWFIGAALMFFRVIRGQRLLARWLEDSTEPTEREWTRCLEQGVSMLGMEKLPSVRVKEGLSSPVVAGLFRPVILVPAMAGEWSGETRKMALLHELGHIQRKDLWLRLAADVTCALHWYNPLVWWMRAKLLTQCEYACDARVIDAGANPREYISALCDVVEAALHESRPQGVVAMADHAPLKLRVSRLMGKPRIGNPWLAVLAAVLTAVTALGLSLVRPAMVLIEDDGSEPSVGYSQDEIDLRHSANPFPEN